MNADKKAVAAYFNTLAENWDRDNAPGAGEAGRILELADIRAGGQILDVACGTGAMFPYYLERGVKSVTGVDISGGMIAQAEKKFEKPNVHLIQADIQACRFDEPFDRCIVFNALAHFQDYAQLMRRLAGFVKPGGRLLVAHGLSREQVNAREKDACLPEPEELAALMKPWFVVDVKQDAPYAVSGVRNDVPAPMVPPTDKR